MDEENVEKSVKMVNDSVRELAKEMEIQILSRSELPADPHPLTKEKPPILILREVRQRVLMVRKK